MKLQGLNPLGKMYDEFKYSDGEWSFKCCGKVLPWKDANNRPKKLCPDCYDIRGYVYYPASNDVIQEPVLLKDHDHFWGGEAVTNQDSGRRYIRVGSNVGGKYIKVGGFQIDRLHLMKLAADEDNRVYNKRDVVWSLESNNWSIRKINLLASGDLMALLSEMGERRDGILMDKDVMRLLIHNDDMDTFLRRTLPTVLNVLPYIIGRAHHLKSAMEDSGALFINEMERMERL